MRSMNRHRRSRCPAPRRARGSGAAGDRAPACRGRRRLRLRRRPRRPASPSRRSRTTCGCCGRRAWCAASGAGRGSGTRWSPPRASASPPSAAALRPGPARPAGSPRAVRLSAEEVRRDQPAQLRQPRGERSLHVEERERPLPHPEARRAGELDQEVTEVRVVTDENRPGRPPVHRRGSPPASRDRGRRRAAFDSHGHAEAVGHELRGLARPDARRGDHDVRDESGCGEQAAQSLGLLSSLGSSTGAGRRAVPRRRGIAGVRMAEEAELHVRPARKAARPPGRGPGGRPPRTA